jgi:hypothetical protein
MLLTLLSNNDAWKGLPSSMHMWQCCSKGLHSPSHDSQHTTPSSWQILHLNGVPTTQNRETLGDKRWCLWSLCLQTAISPAWIHALYMHCGLALWDNDTWSTVCVTTFLWQQLASLTFLNRASHFHFLSCISMHIHPAQNLLTVVLFKLSSTCSIAFSSVAVSSCSLERTLNNSCSRYWTLELQ